MNPSPAGAARRGSPGRHAPRLALSLLRTAAAAWLATTAFLVLGQRILIFQWWQVPKAQAPAGTVTVAVPTADGERLLGFWRAPAPGMPVVVTFHGNAGSPGPHAARFSSGAWAHHGWGVLAIAYRGYPGSTGSPSETGILADAEAAYAFVSARAPGAPVLAHGHSLGTGVAVAMASRHPVSGLYLEAPYDSVLAIVRWRYWWVPSALLLDTMRSDLRIGAVRAPVTMVHGDADPVIPLRFGRALAAAAPGATFVVERGGDHLDVFGSHDHEAEPAFRAAARGDRPPAR